MLKRMKRRHLRKDAIRLASELKSKRPEIAIGADLIAGFPTETEEHHADNLSIIEELDIVHGHVFPYSPRSGTPAARMPQLPRPTVKERAAQLRERVANVRGKWLDGLKGTDLSILVESDGTGYAENYARVAAPPHAGRGEIVAVRPQSVENGLLT